MRRLAVLVGVVAALLAGCGSPAGPYPVELPAVVAPVVADPTAVRIPKLDVSSTLTRTGWETEAGGALAVPPVTEPMQASWFDEGGRPGEAGYPAVILGHVSGRLPGASHSIPGVFAKLDKLVPGDAVVVDRADGSAANFVVERLQRYCKDVEQQREGCKDPLFDESTVYGDTVQPEVRLITCGGLYDATEHSYRSNIVIFARLVP